MDEFLGFDDWKRVRFCLMGCLHLMLTEYIGRRIKTTITIGLSFIRSNVLCEDYAIKMTLEASLAYWRHVYEPISLVLRVPDYTAK